MKESTALQKRGALNASVGRPAGARTASPHDRIKRNLPKMLAAVERTALAGDADAVALCFDIAQHPEKYPLPAE